MEWVKLDTTFYLDAAIVRAGEAAEVLFVRAMAYCGDQENDGLVEREILPRLCPNRGAARAAALGSTRTGSSDGYAIEMRGDADHEDLAAALHDCQAAVVLSGYPSPLYDALYGDWTRYEYATWTGQGNSRAGRTEVAWVNRDGDLLSGLEVGF